MCNFQFIRSIFITFTVLCFISAIRSLVAICQLELLYECTNMNVRIWIYEYEYMNMYMWADKSSAGAGCGSTKSYRYHFPPGPGTLLHNSLQSVAGKHRDVPATVAACLVRRWSRVRLRRYGDVDAVANGDGRQHVVTATDRTTDSCSCSEFHFHCSMRGRQKLSQK